MVDFEKILEIVYSIPADTGGGSSFHKTAIMAGLSEILGLRTYVEIGLYRGRSFFPLATSFAQRNGYSLGIDPYSRDSAAQENLAEDIRDLVQEFIETTDYDQLYDELMNRRSAFDLGSCTTIIRKTSADAFNIVKDAFKSPGMIHIDGNHDTLFVMEDVRNYVSLMQAGDVMVLDDTDWASVKPALALATEQLNVIYSADTFTILAMPNPGHGALIEELTSTCDTLDWQARTVFAESKHAPIPLVSVSLITYNQENYIAQAIQSALDQDTNFFYEIVLGDDASTDETIAICRTFQRANPDKIRLIERPKNLGAVRNYLSTYQECRGRFVAFLEGDDFWIDSKKLQNQVDFLIENPDYAICFHNVYITDNSGELGPPLLKQMADTTTVRDLCTGDYISTPSCMIRNAQVKEIPIWLYDQPGCDWLFDILNAECGKIKYMPKLMAAYRKHDKGIWSGRSEMQQLIGATSMVTMVNHHLDYRYDNEFSTCLRLIRNRLDELISSKISDLEFYSSQPSDEQKSEISRSLSIVEQKAEVFERQNSLARIEHLVFAIGQELARVTVRFDTMDRRLAEVRTKLGRVYSIPRKVVDRVTNALRRPPKALKPEFDLVIVDNAYPHPQSAFRAEEYNAYLGNFKRSIVQTTGEAFNFFNETRSLQEVIDIHEVKNPKLKGKMRACKTQIDVTARLGYTIFIGNAWVNIEFFERNRIPFVFTLYPGGSFLMDDEHSDERMRRVFGSEMFRRVIVTQKLTLDYLTSKGFVTPDRIDFIYGVVTPSSVLERETRARKHFGFGKSTLDICFTAHKYMPGGRDKGYDVFLDVARALVAKVPEARFHVVGGYTADDLPIEGLEGKITFYGGQEPEWFTSFYADKDLILLCNVPFVLIKGAFDGFPTGCGSDAMLHKLALFCTDPLEMNSKFVDGQDLVIVPHDVEAIVERLLWYRQNPAALRELGESGYRQAKHIYSFQSQMAPRLAILKREIAAWSPS